ncbi:MAG: hypothetical protein WC521_02615 [Bdellovibrionales bacterium]|jgi:hypothetical protein
MLKALILFVTVLLLQGCGDECSSYSDFTCGQIEKAKYNAYFYFPDGREYFLGETQGLSSCAGKARSYAASKEMSFNDNWSYICCMIAKGSGCYEKHK